MPGFGFGLGQKFTPGKPSGAGGLVPPEGFAFVVDEDGNYVVDGDGNHIIVESIDMANVLLADALAALTGSIDIGGNLTLPTGNLSLAIGDLFVDGTTTVKSIGINGQASIDLNGDLICNAFQGQTVNAFGNIISDSDMGCTNINIGGNITATNLPAVDGAAGVFYEDATTHIVAVSV